MIKGRRVGPDPGVDGIFRLYAAAWRDFLASNGLERSLGDDAAHEPQAVVQGLPIPWVREVAAPEENEASA